MLLQNQTLTIVKIALFSFSILVLATSFKNIQKPKKAKKHKKEIRNFCKVESIEDCKASIKYCLNKIKSDSMDLNARYHLALSYSLLNDSIAMQQSLFHWNFLLQKDSCYNYALFNRGLCRYFFQDTSGMCQDLKWAKLCKYPDNSDIEIYLKDYCTKH
jgi:hypothetical protein